MSGTVPPSLVEVQRSLEKFGVWDYLVFTIMLVGCAGVGVFYALRGRGEGDAATEYLMGGRKMKVFPVALSLVASLISGIFLLGTPTEIYTYGTEYWFFSISIILMAFISAYVFLPIFHDLQLSSTYEYLQLRFDKKVRLFGSILFTVFLFCWLPIVIYVPALAFNQVTGVNVHIVTPCVCIVCIFYTCVGGLKAVVWTDVLQTWVMIGAFLVVVIKGTADVGGWGVVWDTAREAGRLETPSLDVDPTLRHSLLIILVGGTVYWLQVSTLTQHMVQRYLTLPTLRDARRALFIFVVGVLSLLALVCYTGLLVLTMYRHCDPLSTGLAQSKDQMVPLLVMQVLGDFPGLPGLFMSGVFSAALSSLSTGLNSMSAVFLEDFVKSCTSQKLSERTTNLVMRAVVVVYGALCVAMVFVVERLGTVLQLTMSFGALTNGPMFGIFCAGVLIPWINSTGILCGGIVGLAMSAVVIIGAQNAQAEGLITFATKQTLTDQCDYQFNTSQTFLTAAPQQLADSMDPADSADSVFPLLRMSYVWYTSFGGLITVAVACIVSCITGFQHLQHLDQRCIFRPLRRYLPDKGTPKDTPQ